MLILSMLAPFLLWALMHFLVPWLVEVSLEQWGIDLSPYYPQAASFLLMLIPMLMGMVYGFILLDERDGGILTAISVTPMGKRGYLILRLGIPLILSFIFILLYALLLQLSEHRNLSQWIILSIVISSQSMIILLFLAAFAENKVMGLALSKGYGMILLGPVLDYILPSPFNWIGSYSPLFWASRALLSPFSEQFWFYIFITIVFQTFLLWILFRKFRARSD